MKRRVRKHAKVTSKGQVTVPLAVRRALGVRAGDRLVFEGDAGRIRVRREPTASAFEKYRGIGTPGIGSGRKAILRWLRQLRGR